MTINQLFKQKSFKLLKYRLNEKNNKNIVSFGFDF